MAHACLVMFKLSCTIATGYVSSANYGSYSIKVNKQDVYKN